MREAHCHVPFSHWIKDFHYRVAWIALLSRMGIGRYRLDRTLLGHENVRRHALETAKFIERWTCYRSFGEIARLASERHMATSYHRSEEHTSELQSLMRISYAVFCLKKKKKKHKRNSTKDIMISSGHTTTY